MAASLRRALLAAILIGVATGAFPVRGAGQLGDAGATDLLNPAGPPNGADGGGGAAMVAPDPIDELVWVAGTLHRVLSERDAPGVLVVAALNRALALGEEALVSQLDPLLESVWRTGGGPTRVHRCRSEPDPVEAVLCSLEELAPVAPAAFGRHLADEGARLLNQLRQDGQGLLDGSWPELAAASERTLDPLQRFAESVLEEAWQLRARAASLGAMAGAGVAIPQEIGIDRVLERVLGFAPSARAEEVLAALPELSRLLSAHPLLALSERALLPVHEVLARYDGFVGALSGSVGEIVALAISGEADRLLGIGTDGVTMARDWASRRAWVYLASASAAAAGLESDAVTRIRTVGNAFADLRGGAESFAAQLTGIGEQAAMLALGGNLLSVAASVSAYFGLTPGALGGVGAADLRRVREAIASMERETQGRFDRLDLRFDEVFDLLDTRLTRLEALVATGNQTVLSEIRGLHLEIVALGRRLERMEENLQGYMAAGFDRDYQRTLVLCLEHRARLLPPFDRMGFDQFAGCLADFRTRAVRDARDPLLTDQTTPVDDVAVAQALADPGLNNLAYRLPLLGRVAEQRYGHSGLRGGRGLANPLEWSMATQAYLRMLEDWPDHARSVAAVDLEAIRSAGLEIRGALDQLVGGDMGESSGGFLREVLDGYQRRVSDLTAEAGVLAERHRQAELRRVPASSLLVRIEPLSPGTGPLSVPPRIAQGVPAEVRTAAVLGLGALSLVHQVTVETRELRENFRRRFLLFGTRHDRRSYERTTVEVELRYGAGEVVSRWTATGPWVLVRREEISGGAESQRVSRTLELLADPWGHFAGEIWPQLALEEQGWEPILRPDLTRLARLDREVESELAAHTSAAIELVFSAACGEGIQGGAGLTGADRESATVLRRALDGMSSGRALLSAIVSLGLPYSAEHDPALIESLYGGGAILGLDGVCRAVVAGDNPLRLVWLDEEPGRRAGLLDEVVQGALARAGGRAEPLPLVDRVLQDLDAALRLQRIRGSIARGGV